MSPLTIAQKRVMALMADNAERTPSDVMHALKLKSRNVAGAALEVLTRRGLLVSECVSYDAPAICVYRIAKNAKEAMTDPKESDPYEALNKAMRESVPPHMRAKEIKNHVESKRTSKVPALILDILKNDGPKTVAQLAECTSYTESTMRTRAQELRDAGRIKASKTVINGSPGWIYEVAA